MIINNECLRDIMIYLGNELKINYAPTKIIYRPIHLNTIIDHFVNINNEYGPEDIIYSVDMLFQNNYIIGSNQKTDNTAPGNITITSITYEGQLFLESVRPKTVWDKTKSIVSDVGVHSLKFIEEVAHDVAVESAKALIQQVVNPQP